ncbi:glutathione-disulfide reductase [Paracoccus sp. S1E-3]|uniref:glutathione-disulfide reductase n=1 Tax=Paracoccus sp. S1E-3 TaxID=2756130 RepID=UPI0015EF0237|nr:glutathione-disulfide reductase [Paracoccus sp. S1E-3]MBA4489647.1 glutathione-disulfide reductase [Paracoccus sp. S1E-3]
MSFDYDLFVIGGGSGGVRAARISAGYGAKVGLAEESRMGGTCVIRGCVPKKLMVFASTAPAEAEQARGFGWEGATAGSFSWDAFKAKLDAELNRLEAAYTRGLEAAGVNIFHQRARIVGPHEVELADGMRISARHILIAAGGRPQLPGIPGEDLGLISDDLFLLDRLPGKVLVVGGGFISCEFATILNGLGVNTTLVYRGDKVLRGFDMDLRELLTMQLADIGIHVRLKQQPARLDKAGDGVRVTFADGQSEDFDAVIFATGRTPYTKGLGLEAAGVGLTPNGAIAVDEWSQTNIPSIFAVGDVTDRVNLTPVAIREGHAFADTLFGNNPHHLNHDLVAGAVYTRPHEVATIGMTEDEAIRRGGVEIYDTRFRPMKSLFAGSDARVMMKLIVDEATRKVLGCQIFGPEAGELIQLAAIPITMGATKEDFDRTVAVHPTLAEELVTMRQPTRRHEATAPDRA